MKIVSNSGHSISPISFDSSALSALSKGAGHRGRLPADCLVDELLTTISTLGINLILINPLAAHCAKDIARLLPGNRRDWVFALKISSHTANEASQMSPEHIQHQLLHALHELKTDYIDVLLLEAHDDHTLFDYGEVIGACQTFIEKQLISYFGIQAHSLHGHVKTLEQSDVLLVEPPWPPDEQALDLTLAQLLCKNIWLQMPKATEPHTPNPMVLNHLTQGHIQSLILSSINPDNYTVYDKALEAAKQNNKVRVR